MNTLGTKRGLAGALAFSLPFLSLSTFWGVSLCSFLFFLSALYHFRACRSALAARWHDVRWVVGAFALHALAALAFLLIHPGAGAGSVEKPLRMLLAASALALVLAFEPERAYLWWGTAGGALLGGLMIGHQKIIAELTRPGGLMNAITTGDILMLFALVCLCGVIDMRARGRSLWPALGALAGFAGSLMTGTRGGWPALALAAIVFILYGHVLRNRRLRAMFGAGFVLLAATYFIPATGVRERLAQGVADVTTYYDGGSAYSNMGIRLELWKGAAMLIAEHPLLGQGHPQAKAQMAHLVDTGELDPVVLPAEHFHNDVLHVLVTGGVAGLVAWLSILAAPLAFFSRMLRSRGEGGVGRHAAALAGMLVVLSYFAFGLTEVIFWSVKASLIYALMVFILMGLCLNAKEHDAK